VDGVFYGEDFLAFIWGIQKLKSFVYFQKGGVQAENGLHKDCGGKSGDIGSNERAERAEKSFKVT
jgi:hypothetical protein